MSEPEPCNRGDAWTDEQLRQGWRIEKYISIGDGHWRGGKTRQAAPADLLALYEVRQLRAEVNALLERLG